MCYSGRCVWEGYMGDCNYPTHIKEIVDIYGIYNCESDLQTYYKIIKIKKNIKTTEMRKYKIKKIKNKIYNKK